MYLDQSQREQYLYNYLEEMNNKLTPSFYEKLRGLIEICEGVYWNSSKSGFVIADFSKLQEKLIQSWGHHLRTFLKKLLAYGFKRREIFDGVEYTHPELENTNRSTSSNLKLEEISMEEKLKQQEFITARLQGFTQLIQQSNEGEEEILKRVQKRSSNLKKILNKTMFKALSEGKGMDKEELKRAIEMLKEGVKLNKSDIECTLKKLKENLEEEQELASAIREPEEKQEPMMDSVLDIVSPVKAEQYPQ